MTRRMIGKKEACRIVGKKRAQFDRWRNPKSEYYKPDFPEGRRYPQSFVLYWYEDDVIKWRDDHLTPA